MNQQSNPGPQPKPGLPYPYPFFNPYFSYFPMPQFPSYPLPSYPEPAPYVRPTETKDVKAQEQKISQEQKTGKVKSEPIYLIDDEDLRIKPVEKRAKKPRSDEVVSCRCIKSYCLKQYCLCYKTGIACDDKCSCTGCKNTQDDLNEKLKPKLEKKLRCKCNRSQCIKKYCECYSAKRKCDSGCQCVGCEN